MLELRSAPDYVIEDDIRDLGFEPEIVRILCPWATEYVGLDGQRCWAAEDLAELLGGNHP